MDEDHYDVTISQPRLLQSDYVHMKDEMSVFQKFNKIIKDDKTKLQFVTDFDSTITKQHSNGAPVPNSLNILLGCKSLPASCKEENLNLYEKYSPLVLDENVSIQEGDKTMTEWYTQINKSIRGIKLDRKEITESIRSHSNFLRSGSHELFTKLNCSEVPVLVISAGIGDVIEATLRQHGMLFGNVTVMSNFFKYDGDTVDGFKNADRLINIYNKGQRITDYFHSLRGRHNVILLGDSLLDAKIVDEVESVETVLKIGFFYNRIDDKMPVSKYEEQLSLFKDAFDIVLEDDQTMKIVLELLTFVNYKL